MSKPPGFSWVDKPHLAAMGRPESLEELTWLRRQGIDLLLSLTEDPPRHDWVDEAGLLLFHAPVEDMAPPSQQQLDLCMSAIRKANQHNMGVAVHCGAGMGRTGVILACYFVQKGLSAREAITRVRRMRPGSVETAEQSDAVTAFAQRHKPSPPA